MNKLLYDWNKESKTFSKKYVCDETLRDGLQDVSIKNPSLKEKIKYVDDIENLGVQRIDLGFPSANTKNYSDTLELLKHIDSSNYKVESYCAARTVISDIEPILRIQDKVGRQLGVAAFLGCSPIRCYVENWSKEFLIDKSSKAIEYCIKNGLEISFVGEDITRARPDDIKALFLNAKKLGCNRFVLADTVGTLTPKGVKSFVSFIKEMEGFYDSNTILEWHGHNDRGYGLINALEALESGCDGAHGTLLGVGERTGNTSLELLVLNLFIENKFDGNIDSLVNYVNNNINKFGLNICDNYPLVGKNAFLTSSGVHASAILKSLEMNSSIQDYIYSSVPASKFGLEQDVKINNMSGKSNIQFWIKKNNLIENDKFYEEVLKYANENSQYLSDKFLFELYEKVTA